MKKAKFQDNYKMIAGSCIGHFNQQSKQCNKLIKGQCDLTFNDQMLVRIIRARQFCNCPSILGDQYFKISKDKLAVFKGLCTELIKQNGHKIVVFLQYRETVNVLLQELQKQKYQVVLLKSFKNKFQGAQYFNSKCIFMHRLGHDRFEFRECLVFD